MGSEQASKIKICEEKKKNNYVESRLEAGVEMIRILPQTTNFVKYSESILKISV